MKLLTQFFIHDTMMGDGISRNFLILIRKIVLQYYSRNLENKHINWNEIGCEKNGMDAWCFGIYSNYIIVIRHHLNSLKFHSNLSHKINNENVAGVESDNNHVRLRFCDIIIIVTQMKMKTKAITNLIRNKLPLVAMRRWRAKKSNGI